jgi:hypothetical protein
MDHAQCIAPNFVVGGGRLIVMVGDDRYLYCGNCNEVHKATRFDQAPIYDLQGSEVFEIPTDDQGRFSARHAGHAVEALSSVAEIWVNPQGPVDPMAESFVALANQRDFIVLHRWRRSIAEPIAYRVMPRQLSLWPSTFDREALKQWTRNWRSRWLRGKVRAGRKFHRIPLNQPTLFTAESMR